MTKSLSINYNLNNFFQKIVFKKRYLKILKNKILLLNNVKEQDYKSLVFRFHLQNIFRKNVSLVTYIFNFNFAWTNTLFNVMDSSGKSQFFCSAGDLLLKKKNKKRRALVFKSINTILVWKLKFLQNKPIALHFKNVKFMTFWIFRKLAFVQSVKNFVSYPYNGCRQKKVRRKKLRKNGWVV